MSPRRAAGFGQQDQVLHTPGQRVHGSILDQVRLKPGQPGDGLLACPKA